MWATVGSCPGRVLEAVFQGLQLCFKVLLQAQQLLSDAAGLLKKHVSALEELTTESRQEKIFQRVVS